jgi:hypothetical protein
MFTIGYGLIPKSKLCFDTVPITILIDFFNYLMCFDRKSSIAMIIKGVTRNHHGEQTYELGF